MNDVIVLSVSEMCVLVLGGARAARRGSSLACCLLWYSMSTCATSSRPIRRRLLGLVHGASPPFTTQVRGSDHETRVCLGQCHSYRSSHVLLKVIRSEPFVERPLTS